MKTLRTCCDLEPKPITYNRCGDNDRREENSLEDSKCLLQVVHQRVVARCDDVIPEGHEEIRLLGDLQ